MKYLHIILTTVMAILFTTTVIATPCTFDNTKTCSLYRDILNDISPTGLKYYAATNYDHRISGEIEVYNASLVAPYSDAINAPGQIKLIAQFVNNTIWQSGEIMTRANLNQAPYNAPTLSMPWTTQEMGHGYLEVIAKMPKCEISDDGFCQNNVNPVSYNSGLWPAIWMEPTMDANWPQNGEIDIAEAYLTNTCFNLSTATLHFNGTDARCNNNDCTGAGFSLGNASTVNALFNNYHTWGFEWQKDPTSSDSGILMTGYFDNVKVWGPTSTDSLPADGPNALSRGFNDPNGGYYLIVNLAIGGPYAGPPNPHLQGASMYIQSIKAYSVDSIAPSQCLPPINVQSTVSADKKQITLSWQTPANSATVLNYQVADWLNRVIFQSAGESEHCFSDTTLPGTAGTFTYYLYSNCVTGLSSAEKIDVIIN